MKKFAIILCLQVMALSLSVQPGEDPEQIGSYLGQKPPGRTPEVFAPGIVSTGAHEFAGSFTPDGREYYFTRRESRQSPTRIMVTRCIDGTWTPPEPAAFNATAAGPNAMSFEPMVTPDGKRLYFSSDRPLTAGSGPAGPPQLNIWYAERAGDGWAAPQDAGTPFNPMQVMYVSTARSGTIYTTDISKGPAGAAIAVMKPTASGYGAPQRLGPPVNGDTPGMYPFIAPDESYLIFSRMRPGEAIDQVLFVSYRNADGSWGEPRALDLGMRAGTPCVSPDGKYLFFSGGERGKGDIYWVSAEILRSPAQTR